MNHGFKLNDLEFDVGLSRGVDGYRLHLDDAVVPINLRADEANGWTLSCDGGVDRAIIASHGDHVFVHLDGTTYHLEYEHPLQRLAELLEAATDDTVKATMPGSMIALEVKAGQQVKTGDTLLIIESMKMETTFAAPRDGVVQNVHVGIGDTFDKGTVLLTLEPAE